MKGMVTIIWTVLIFISNLAFALDEVNTLSQQIQVSLKNRNPGAEIRIPSLSNLLKNPEVTNLYDLSSVRLIEDRENGIALFEIVSTQGESIRIQVPYEAWIKVPVAKRKIYPNTKLSESDFRLELINFSSGTARNYRGIIVTELEALNLLENKQTLLEGQFVPEQSVRKIPDVRKGETVRVELNSGEMSLITTATALEAGTMGQMVPIMTNKTKRELTGILRPDRVVEVRI